MWREFPPTKPYIPSAVSTLVSKESGVCRVVTSAWLPGRLPTKPHFSAGVSSRRFPRGVSTETCQNLTFEAVCKDAVRGLVRTESGVLAQVSAGRLAPWLAPIEGVDRTAVDAPPLARLWTLPAFAKGDTARLGSGTKEKAQDSYGRPDQQAGSSVAPIAGLSDFIHRAAGKCWHVG